MTTKVFCNQGKPVSHAKISPGDVQNEKTILTFDRLWVGLTSFRKKKNFKFDRISIFREQFQEVNTKDCIELRLRIYKTVNLTSKYFNQKNIYL